MLVLLGEVQVPIPASQLSCEPAAGGTGHPSGMCTPVPSTGGSGPDGWCCRSEVKEAHSFGCGRSPLVLLGFLVAGTCW